MKLSNEGLSSSYIDLLSPDVKFYLDELVERILEDNQVREERIMGRNEGVEKEGEDVQVKLKAKMEASEARVIA